MKEQVQQVGSFLSGMVMPNIGAFIAWGLITALFIPSGWLPNERFAVLVGPMIHYLLPVLLGYTGGKLVHDVRGGVVGAAATMGVIVGADIPMFIGAMIVGPMSGWLMKRIDHLLENHIPSGFEMLFNNFSAGILAMLLALLSLLVVGPFAEGLSTLLGGGLRILLEAGMLPLVALVIEPAKVLFLNNAINHGLLAPLGVAEVTENGKAIHFLLESNPGPGLGVLLAVFLLGKGTSKQTAPGAIVIHFFGGIHEIYFPYILANPRLILGVISGGLLANAWFVLTGAGLIATPSPGSVFALMAMTPKGLHLSVLGGIVIGAMGSLLISMLLMKIAPTRDEEQ